MKRAGLIIFRSVLIGMSVGMLVQFLISLPSLDRNSLITLLVFTFFWPYGGIMGMGVGLLTGTIIAIVMMLQGKTNAAQSKG
jgi:uncharacterized membrane protein YraQ (UPF0718 family)